MTSNHYIVSGKVQGVFFRASTKQKADQLSICGWVQNLPDGNVEIAASGSDESMKLFEEWIHIGPEMAKVTSVEKNKIANENFTDFKIVRSKS